jgi:hypothetical protein
MDSEGREWRDAAPPTRNFLEFPARLSPRPPGGAVHRLRIDPSGLTVSTLAGLYGNQEERVVLTIPRPTVVGFHLHRPPLGLGNTSCEVQYRDESLEVHSFRFRAVGWGGWRDGSPRLGENAYTVRVAEAMQAMSDSAFVRPPLPQLGLGVVSGPVKLIAGLALAFIIALSVAGRQALNGPFLAVFGVATVPLVLGALAIDTVRLHTSWHPVVKWAASIVIFLLAFILLVTGIFLVELLGAL